jgi:fructose-1,6-bisphosphatase I/sedoheptulose-1,7-bisphosphatase
MTTRRRFTLTQYLIEQRRRFPGASGDFNALLLDVALACKAIARSVAFGELSSVLGHAEPEVTTNVNVQGEEQKRLDVISNEYFTQMTEWGGHLAGMASEEMDHPYQIPEAQQRGKYLLVFDPLDGSSNIDVNVTVGSIFSILRAPQDVIDSGRDVVETDFFQPGSQQMAAGYALYGPTTMLVLSVGNGAAGFTLDPNLGQFMLTHPNLQIPADTQEFAINASNSRFWEPPVKRYVDECLAGKTGPARQGLQHALDCQHGGRGAPHPHARRCLHVPARHQGSQQTRASAPAVRGQPRSVSSSSRPAAAPPPAASPC